MIQQQLSNSGWFSITGSSSSVSGLQQDMDVQEIPIVIVHMYHNIGEPQLAEKVRTVVHNSVKSTLLGNTSYNTDKKYVKFWF